MRNLERQMLSNKPQVSTCGGIFLRPLIAYWPMKKGLFNRENIEKIVRLVPRPTMNGKLIARSRNFWLILQDYGEGIEILNKKTNHGGQIPFDSIREWREPDMVILSAHLNLGKDGVFELSPVVDGPETEMITEDEEILPERMTLAKEALLKLSPQEIEVLKEILLKETMEQGEIVACCSRHGIENGYKFFWMVNGRTSFLEVGERQKVWIKPAFVSILVKLLLRSNTGITTSPQPPQSS